MAVENTDIVFVPNEMVLILEGLREGVVKEVVVDRTGIVQYVVNWWENGRLHRANFEEEELEEIIEQ